MYVSIPAKNLRTLVKQVAPTLAERYPIFTKIFLSDHVDDVVRLIQVLHGAAHIIWEHDELVSEELWTLRTKLYEYTKQY